MSDAQGTAWGMCEAFGCPLLGTMGGEGRWYCFCHVNRPSNFNDAITRVLREQEGPVVDLTLVIRRDSLSGKWSKEAAAAVVELRNHPKGEELKFQKGKDISSRSWLYRLERHLVEAVANIGVQQRIQATVPSVPVIGPTHAMQHYTEPQS
jgi:hypothetical protein